MIQGVIFDFDNTLYDYDSINTNALQTTFYCISKQFDINIDIINNTYNKINKNIKSSNNSVNKFNKHIYIKQLFETLNIPIKFIHHYVTIYNDNFYKLFKLYDGVIELFQWLKQKHIKIAILSNNIFLQQLDKLKFVEIIDYIDIIQTSDECGEEKPNKQIFYLIQSKLNISFDHLVAVGDNYDHDIVPSIELKMLPFWFIYNNPFQILDNIIKFGNFIDLNIFFINHFKITDELVFLSKYFGQSNLNVQGPGGNISVKSDDILYIKSSGCILGNISYNEGYCLVDNIKCIEMLNKYDNSVKNTKIFGDKIPSIETYFHSFMKKYTVHLHFILANVFLCSETNLLVFFKDFTYNHKIIDYYTPGIELASEVYKKYTKNDDIYFLKNHGIIITADNIQDILNYYDYIFNYFNTKLDNKYNNELICFKLNEIYRKHSKNVVVKHISKMDYKILQNMIICFPDLAVFAEKIIEINDLDILLNKFNDYDIILYQENVFFVTENMTKMYSLIEIIESYKLLFHHNYQQNNQNGNLLVEINNILHIQNMPEEKYRKL